MTFPGIARGLFSRFDPPQVLLAEIGPPLSLIPA
jgi:hypothetical protein